MLENFVWCELGNQLPQNVLVHRCGLLDWRGGKFRAYACLISDGGCTATLLSYRRNEKVLIEPVSSTDSTPVWCLKNLAYDTLDLLAKWRQLQDVLRSPESTERLRLFLKEMQ